MSLPQEFEKDLCVARALNQPMLNELANIQLRFYAYYLKSIDILKVNHHYSEEKATRIINHEIEESYKRFAARRGQIMKGEIR
jgi:hypothetical protein